MSEKLININDNFDSWLLKNNISDDDLKEEDVIDFFNEYAPEIFKISDQEYIKILLEFSSIDDYFLSVCARTPKLTEEDVIKLVEKYGAKILGTIELDYPELINDNVLGKLFPETVKGEKVVLTYNFFEEHKELCDVSTLFINEFKKGNVIDILYYYTGNNNEVYEAAIENGYRLRNDDECGFVKNLWNKDPLIIKEIKEGNFDIVSSYTGENKEVFKLAIEKGFRLTPEILKSRYNSYSRYGNHSNDLLVLSAIEAGNIEIVPYYPGDNKEIFKLAIEKGFRLTNEMLEKHSHLRETEGNELFFIKSIEEGNFDIVRWYTGKNKEVYELAIEKGFRITKGLLEEHSNLQFVDQYFIKEIEENNFDLLPYYRGRNIEKIYLLAMEKGFKITDDILKDVHVRYKINSEDSIFIKSIENGNIEIVPYYRGKNIEKIFNLAEKKGFKITKEILEKHTHLQREDLFFAKAIEEGNVDIFSYYSGSNMNLVKKAITDYNFVITEDLLERNKYIGNEVDLIDHIANVNKEWLKYMNTINNKIFPNVIDAILSKEEQDYLSNFSEYNLLKTYLNTPINVETRETLLSMFDVSFLSRFSQSTNISIERLLKMALFSDEISELSRIIKSGNLNDFYAVYNELKKYFSDELPEKTLLKIARNYQKYSNFCKNVCEIELSEKQQAGLRFLFNTKQFIDIHNLDELQKIEELAVEKLKEGIDGPNVTLDEIKDMLCIYLSNHSMEEIKGIYERDIRISILEKIIQNTKDESLRESCMTMNIFFTVLSESIFAVNSIEDLRKIGHVLLETSDKVSDVRNYFSSLKEIIRTIYEKEANESLLDFNNLPKEAEWKKTKDGIEYLSLEHCSYALYAHVDHSIENLFNLKMQGKPTICLSPISNLGVKYYSKGITVLYNFIPSGNFIGSSNRNMGSNNVIKENSLDFTDVSKRFFQLPIKDSSALSMGHPETLSLRPGLIPCGIAIRGDEPTEEELEAFEQLKKMVPSGHEVYLVKPQKEGTVVTLDEESYAEDSKLEEVDYSNNHVIKKLTELKSELLDTNIATEEVYNIISLKGRIGGTHDFYECNLKGEEGTYYLKPGIRKDGRQVDPYRCYAMECGYLIQKLVNPDSAIPVKVVEAPVGVAGENVLCSAIKVIPNTTNYDNLIVNLSEKEIEFFMKEFIVDHLLFSYDTKKENFLKDSNGKAYGIDKEQALKFATSSNFIKNNVEKIEFDTSLTYDFDPNGVGIIYKDIFKNYQKGTQDIPDRIFEECKEIAARISGMDDEVYLSNFINFINSYTENEEKRELLKQSILARKNNLVLDYNNFVELMKTKKDEFAGGKQL